MTDHAKPKLLVTREDVKWAAFAEHVDGSLWAAFEAGWRAATPAAHPHPAPPVEVCPTCGKRSVAWINGSFGCSSGHEWPATQAPPVGDEALRAETEAWLREISRHAQTDQEIAANALFRRWLATSPSAGGEDTARIDWLEARLVGSGLLCIGTDLYDYVEHVAVGELVFTPDGFDRLGAADTLRSAIDAARQPQARKET